MARTTRTLAATLLSVAVAAFLACSNDDATSNAGGVATDDAGSTEHDAAKDDDAVEDAGADGATAQPDGSSCGPIVTTAGETCTGFGPSADSCDPACGQPFGYVCVNGAPPGFAGCRKASETALGETYCCPKNDCVAQPDQDGNCSAAPATPHRYQCPPAGDAGSATPPAGCVEHGSGASAVEKFYCCP